MKGLLNKKEGEGEGTGNKAEKAGRYSGSQTQNLTVGQVWAEKEQKGMRNMPFWKQAGAELGQAQFQLVILDIIIYWGRLQLRLSSIEFIFYWGHLPLRSSSIEVVFHWNHLLLRLSFIDVVVFHWGHFPLRLSSIEVVFHWGRLPFIWFFHFWNLFL